MRLAEGLQTVVQFSEMAWTGKSYELSTFV